MKYFPLIITILLAFNCHSQKSENERFTFAAFTDPGATFSDGFNMGVEIEYQGKWGYVRPAYMVFPNLRGKDYSDLIGSLGFNIHNRSRTLRAYAGIRLGTIFRAGQPHATWGQEIGFDVYTRNGFFFGLRRTNDRRTDAIVWGINQEPYWLQSNYLRLGVAW